MKMRKITPTTESRSPVQSAKHANPESAKWDTMAQLTRHTPYSHGWLHVPA